MFNIESALKGMGDIAGMPPPKQLSQRSYIINQIQKLTGMPFRILYFKHLGHIPGGEKGTKLLYLLYDIAQTEDTEERKRIRFWQELKKTRCE
jgi:hypothetical protein